MKKQKKVAKAEKKPAVLPALVAPPPPTVSQTFLKDLTKQVEEQWEEQAAHYGWDGPMSETIANKIQAILRAPTEDAGIELQRRAIDTIQIMILGAWARGKIPGPLSRYSLERRIKQAESLVKMLEAKGQNDAAQTQLERVEQLREQLEDFLAQAPH